MIHVREGKPRWLLLMLLITAVLWPALAASSIEFVGEKALDEPLFVAVDEEGRIYATQGDGMIKVFTLEGEVLFSLGGEIEGQEPLLEEPVGIDLYEGRIYVTDEGLGKVVIFSQEGEYLDSFGRKGGGAKEFKKPQGICVYNGVIYVADMGNHRVQVFGPNGVYMGTIGAQGPDNALLENPTDVAIDHRGYIYVADRKNENVKLFDPAGKYVRVFAENVIPGSLAYDRKGVYICDEDRHSIVKYDLDGKRVAHFGSYGTGRAQFKSMGGIAVDRAGKVYVADGKRGLVQVFLPKGSALESWPEKSPPGSTVTWLDEISVRADRICSRDKETLYAVDEKEESLLVIKKGRVAKTIKMSKWEPVAVSVDPEGFLWVLDKGQKRLLKIDEAGTPLLSVGSGGSKEGYFDGPTDIAISTKGIIYVADRDNHRVQVFNTDGIFLNVVGGETSATPLESPLAIALDSKGTLYVLDDDSYNVVLFSPEGQFLRRFGKEGEGRGQFKNPVSIAATDNELFVLDAGENSVKVFTPSGDFLRLFASEGSGSGDLNEPASISMVDDVHFLISDTGNERIQSFKTLYTPSVPANVVAKAGMRKVALTWDANPETFVEKYLVFRSEHAGRGFKEVAASEVNTYEDGNVLPDKKYYYSISAVAREGNTGEKSEAVSAEAAKYKVSMPSGLQLTAHDHSVDFAWQPNEESFTACYVIYREKEAKLIEVGRTEEASFSEKALLPQTKYTYGISAVSTDGVESRKIFAKTTTHVSTRPPLEIQIFEMHDVFSNTYKIYENEGIGRIKVANNTANEISKLKVSFTIKEYMDFPTEREIENLPPGESLEFVLKAVFNNRILEVTEDTPIQTEIKASYYEHATLKILSKCHTINIYEKHRMLWDERDRVATFITPKDPIVLEFARSVVTQYQGGNDPLLYASALFNALGVLGMTYMQDPSNPYQIVSGKTDFVDYVQYPRETLKRKSGDCDDLVSLYAATLESIGIPTRLLFCPGHIFVMFCSGIEAKAGTDTMDGMLVAQAGYLWVPVEATLVGSSFMMAWEAGSRGYHEWEEEDLDSRDTRNAWKRYKPASLAMSSWRPDHVSREAIEENFCDESDTIRKVRLRVTSKEYLDILGGSPDNVQALMQLGIIYAQAGGGEDALEVFSKALEHDGKNAALKNNLGNVHFLGKRYEEAKRAYEEAKELDPADPHIWINLARCYLKMKKKDEARGAFEKAKEINPEIQREYRAISLELMGVM